MRREPLRCDGEQAWRILVGRSWEGIDDAGSELRTSAIESYRSLAL